MKLSTSLVVALAAGLIAATPVLAQSTTDTAKPNASDASDASKKQPTQGAPAGFKPQEYGAAAKKQQSQGAPAGFKPQEYGAVAKKQPTQGAPAGFEPQKYGSDKATKSE
jgi:hypothetical protein